MSFPRDVVRRFEASFQPIPICGCWLWMGATTSDNGYGQFMIDYINMGAHRVSYEIYKGPIPGGKLVLHKCDMKCCVNPNHLYIGSARRNAIDRMLRGDLHHYNHDKEFCKAGHALSGDNLYTRPEGGRACMTCRRIWKQESRSRLNAQHCSNLEQPYASSALGR